MNFLLNRKKLLFSGLTIIAFYYFLNKFDFIFHATQTKGIAVSNSEISFESNAVKYQLTAIRNIEYFPGEQVQVIYLNSNPNVAYIFSFSGFWYTGLIVCLVPLALWFAFILAFFNENDAVLFSPFTKNKLFGIQKGQKKLGP